MPAADFAHYAAAFRRLHDWLPEALAKCYLRLYGTRATALVGGGAVASGAPGSDYALQMRLGRHFGSLFYEREAAFLIAEEWAQSADDIVVRRTKHGLHLTAAEIAAFRDWMAGAGAAHLKPDALLRGRRSL